MSYSKSMFSNFTTNQYRIVYNPVFKSTGTGTGTGTDYLNQITNDDITVITTIETDYTSIVANQLYEQISNDYSKYTQLFVLINAMRSRVTNTKILLFLKIIEEALVSAINTRTLYSSTLDLKLRNAELQRQITDITNETNQTVVQLMTTSGTLSITKRFKLVPIFNYYILIYGLPAYGVGFDPCRIAFLEEILRKNGINPYS